MVGASSGISEEIIELSFLECFQITIFLRYSFLTTSSVFCFLFYFIFQSAVQNRGVHYTRVNTVLVLSPFYGAISPSTLIKSASVYRNTL